MKISILSTYITELASFFASLNFVLWLDFRYLNFKRAPSKTCFGRNLAAIHAKEILLFASTKLIVQSPIISAMAMADPLTATLAYNWPFQGQIRMKMCWTRGMRLKTSGNTPSTVCFKMLVILSWVLLRTCFRTTQRVLVYIITIRFPLCLSM